ncbi:MAG: hypothetical protein WD492_09585 [Alkalispirochaeta sp.]
MRLSSFVGNAGLDPDEQYPRTWREMMDLSEAIVRRDGESGLTI